MKLIKLLKKTKYIEVRIPKVIVEEWEEVK